MSNRPDGADRHVWIVNHHASIPSKDGREGRHLALARHMIAEGWTSTLFIASTTHPSGRQKLHGWRWRKRLREAGVDCVWIRSLSYGTSLPRRALGMVTFAAGILLPGATRGVPTPDVVIGSTVHPLAAWAGAILARRRRVPFVYEIRDVWPESLVEVGQLGPNGLLTKAIRALSLSLCRRAAFVLSPLPSIRRYLDENGLADVPVVWVSNGVSDSVAKSDGDSVVERPFTFMYLGSHGAANGLELILSAFDLACSKLGDSDMQLRMVGDGPKKHALQSFAASLAHGDRIHFEERIRRDQVADRALEADCLIASLLDLPVYKYGMSLNKIFDYLLSARPIVFAGAASNNPVREADAGIVVGPGDVEALAGAIVEMFHTGRTERAAMGKRGRAHVLENYSYQALAHKLVSALNDVAPNGALNDA